ncbi:MAG: hypothetical protein JWL61_227, partial [Gemmatimonadetes bacterium]|nr:hypothetical protein [Gemmatimonadota bacterium]
MPSCRHLIVMALTATASLASAQTATKRPLAIEDYYRFKTVSAPELSPDGRWAAFT